MSQSYCNLIYHLVFSTKGRRAWLQDGVRERTHAYLGGALRDEGGVAIAVNGVADHVHILARLRQDKALSDVLRDVKANSSGWIHKTLADLPEFAWQPGFSGFTVSPSQVDKVRAYIENQQEHHKKRSFEEELIALLKAHGIPYDERYL